MLKLTSKQSFFHCMTSKMAILFLLKSILQTSSYNLNPTVTRLSSQSRTQRLAVGIFHERASVGWFPQRRSFLSASASASSLSSSSSSSSSSDDSISTITTDGANSNSNSNNTSKKKQLSPEEKKELKEKKKKARDKRREFIGMAKAVDRGQWPNIYNPGGTDGISFTAKSGLPDRSKPFLVLGIESSCDDTGGTF